MTKQTLKGTPTRELVLTGDIGGTNARFALVDADNNVTATETLKVIDYENFDEALKAFLDDAGHAPYAACFAVAGPVTKGRAAFTNSPWEIDQRALLRHFGFEEAIVINDFEALSRYALSPKKEDIIPIKEGNAVMGAPVLTIGPGTGLGQGIAMPHGGGVTPIPTEGGHVVLPAITPTEMALKQIINDAIGRPPSAEDAISGNGLVRLHRAMAIHEGRTIPDATPVEITAAALGGDKHAIATVRQFSAFLGTVAGNAALATGARGGVMLAGGILPKIKPLFLNSTFKDRFVGNSLMSHYLAAIPVYLLVTGDAALRGAANILHDRGR